MQFNKNYAQQKILFHYFISSSHIYTILNFSSLFPWLIFILNLVAVNYFPMINIFKYKIGIIPRIKNKLEKIINQKYKVRKLWQVLINNILKLSQNYVPWMFFGHPFLLQVARYHQQLNKWYSQMFFFPHSEATLDFSSNKFICP